MKKKVIVGLSGGVDSSVAAYLLQKQGFDVIALFMRNWNEEPCPSTQDYEDALSVAQMLKIPLYTVDFSKEYFDRVFAVCLKQFEKGITPNPDILCNKEIKFELFLKKALAMGGDFVATGHYSQIHDHQENLVLAQAKDQEKDQSYFLYAINPSVLKHVLFPLGGMLKSEVRKIAHECNLITASKKDSTGICFIGKRDFKTFLQNFVEKQRGDIVDTKGCVVGSHDGVAFYTIGQRRGLNLGGAAKPYFVVGKDLQNNHLIVGDESSPQLYQKQCIVHDLNWFILPQKTFECRAKIRYRSQSEPCQVSIEDEVKVFFKEPQKAVTPGQSIVFYDDQICLGGGIIG